jgi:hypothetical protein
MKEGFVICINTYIDVRLETTGGPLPEPGTALPAPLLYQRLKIQDGRFFGSTLFYSFERYNLAGANLWFCSDAFRVVATVEVIKKQAHFHGVRKLYFPN